MTMVLSQTFLVFYYTKIPYTKKGRKKDRHFGDLLQILFFLTFDQKAKSNGR